MPDNQKPLLPEIAEGDMFLFVRLNPKSGEFQCLYPNLFSALALHSLAATHLDQLKTANMAAAPAPGVPRTPHFQLPSLDAIMRTRKQS